MKMNIYRIVKSKSTWILWIISGILSYISLSAPVDLDTDTAAVSSDTIGEAFAQLVQGGDLLLILVIFIVLLVCGDYSTGYIKNVAGKVKGRTQLLLASLGSVMLYIAMLFAMQIVVSIVMVYVYNDNPTYDSVGNFLVFTVTAYLLYTAFAAVLICVITFVRSMVICMAGGLVYTGLLAALLWPQIDKFLSGFMPAETSFSILKYLIIQNIYQLSFGMGFQEYITPFVVAMLYLTAAFVIANYRLTHSDLC